MKLWYYIMGYVIIEVKGFTAERFVNLALARGIDFHSISSSPSGITLCVRLSDFKRLKACQKKTKCRLIIKKRCGIPFFIHRNRKRYFFAGGIIIFVALLYTLSSFVWQISIVGNKNISNAEILASCEEIGFKTGVYKGKLDTKAIVASLKNKYPNISWATIQLEGTLATIKIAEGIPKPKPIDTSKPCNIIAANNGIITDIITSRGTPIVKINDTVKKGDILVSGELIIKNDETGVITDYVHSIADIKAKQWYNISVEVPLSYTTKDYTGNSEYFYTLELFDYKLEPNFLKKKIYFKNYDTIIDTKQFSASHNYPLPLFLTKKSIREYSLTTHTKTEEQAKLEAEKKLNEEIIKRFTAESEILDKKLVYSKSATTVRLDATVTVKEAIGKLEYINNLEGRTVNGTGENTNRE